MAQENIQIRFRQTSHPAARRKTTSHLLTPSCILYQLSSCKVSDRTCRRKRAATIACAECGNHEPLFFEPACICSATLRFVPSFAPRLLICPQTNFHPIPSQNQPTTRSFLSPCLQSVVRPCIFERQTRNNSPIPFIGRLGTHPHGLKPDNTPSLFCKPTMSMNGRQLEHDGCRQSNHASGGILSLC